MKDSTARNDEREPFILHGLIMNVNEHFEGDYLIQDEAATATTLHVDDVSIFDEDGGELVLIDDSNNQWPYDYTAIDVSTQIITLDGAIAEDHDAGEVVRVFPFYKIRKARVSSDYTDGDVVHARVPHSLFSELPVGPRSDVMGEGDTSIRQSEEVLVILVHDDWIVLDVLGVPGQGRIRHKWSAFGRLQVVPETETHDLDVDDDMNLIKVRTRVKNAPTGNDIIVKIWKNNTELVCTLTIADGTKKDANNNLDIDFADDDTLSCSIEQVGSTYPGRNLAVLAVFK